jgi:LuxR family transcriptional regulator, quorum-sensing system regulator BjaR1
MNEDKPVPGGRSALGPSEAKDENALVEIVRRLDSALSSKEMGERLLALTQRFGVERVMAGALPCFKCDAPERSSGRIWSKLRIGDPDPRAIIDLEQKGTHHFFCADGDVRHLHKSEQDHCPCNEFESAEAVGFPIVTIDRRRSGLFYFGRRLDRSDDALDILSFIANYAFARMLKVDCDLEMRPKLGDRQKDVLKWAAQGKTDWEIATILDVSEYTVDKYMRQCREALNASNRTATIVLAMRYGLIA